MTTVALPTLIAPELVIVQPMTSITGFIMYIKYTAGSNKGQTKQGDVFNDPFRLGKVDVNYTSQAVVESIPADATTFTPAWTPVVNGKVTAIAADGTETELTLVDGSVTFEAGTYTKIKYLYDNVVIPQNDLPILNAETATITLTAKARRIAIYYSQIAAYQAKTDYGFDLGKQLADKAVGQLSYEIDTEVTDLIINTAGDADADLVFNKRVPFGISKAQHYEGFSEIVEIGKQKIYDRTKRFAPTYILIASNVLPILTFINGFKAANASKINGPYFAGTLNGLKVFVTPNIEAGKFVLGVNGDDLMSSVAVYAPYMAIVPTQLLGYADGGMSQGFSTMYDLQVLNADLAVAGKVINEDYVVATEEVGE